MKAPVLDPRGNGLRRAAGGVARALVTPLVPDDYVDLVAPLRSGTCTRARVVQVRPETRDAVTLVLEPGRGWRGHRPGQYVRIGVDVDGVRHWRAYSITSPAQGNGRITITVKAVADGIVSQHLVRCARPGLLLQLDEAAGEFTLPDPLPTKLMFVTAGSGITPVMGILRHYGEQLRDVVVVHSAPNAAEVIFGGELRQLAALHDWRLLEWHSDSRGLMTAHDLELAVPDLAGRETWACGPAGLLDAVERHFTDRGAGERLHTERFRTKAVVVGDGGHVTFTRAGRTVDADAATPLLTAGENAGVLMPSGCRMGICFSCVVPLRDGAVRDLRTGELTVAADDEVLVQTCISAAAGNCALDL